MTIRVNYYPSDLAALHDWLSEHIGPARGKLAGEGWVMVNDFNFRARRKTTFWVEFEDWVTEEQLLAFKLTWPE